MSGKQTKMSQRGGKKAKSGKKNTTSRTVSSGAAPTSMGAKVRGTVGSSIRQQGTDQLATVNLNSSTKGIIGQYVITPSSLPRLGKMAASFQRIRYHRLRFEIITGVNTSVNGVYVAGFVKDATDPVAESSASSTLLASGGVATKFWQSTDVIVQSFPDLYYTSPDTSEARWSSPGSLVIAVVSPPNAIVPFEIFVHWDVTLSMPSYESGEGSSAKFYTSRVDIFTTKDQVYLSKRDGSGWKDATGSDFTPPLPAGSIFRLPSFRVGDVHAKGGTTLNGIFSFCRFQTDSNVSSRVLYPITDQGENLSEQFYDYVHVIAAQEEVSLYVPPSLNSQRIHWYHSPGIPSASSPERSGTSSRNSSFFQGEPQCLGQVKKSPSRSSSSTPTTPSNEMAPAHLCGSQTHMLPADFSNKLLKELKELLLQEMSSTSWDLLTELPGTSKG